MISWVRCRVQAHKLLCLVELLMGEIPQRSIFRQKGRAALKPYFELARVGRALSWGPP